MGQFEPVLLALLALMALNVCHVLADPNSRLLGSLFDRQISFLSTNNLETCNVTGILPSEELYHQATGFMRGLYAIEVHYHIPIYEKEDKMSDVYRKFDVIAKKLNVKHHCSKYDMMENFLIPFYFRAIRVQHSGTKFYPTLATDPLTSVIRTSEFENPTTKFKMLPVDDIVLFATHMIKAVTTLHDIDFALGPIEPKNFGIWKFVRQDGVHEKRFVPTDLKSAKEKTAQLVKTNLLEVLATISEVMGAYDRSKDLKYKGYYKRIATWVFPSEDLKQMILDNIKAVYKHSVLKETFVHDLKAKLEDWLPKTNGNKDPKSKETQEHFEDDKEDNPTDGKHKDSKEDTHDHIRKPNIRKRRVSPTHEQYPEDHGEPGDFRAAPYQHPVYNHNPVYSGNPVYSPGYPSLSFGPVIPGYVPQPFNREP